MPGQRSEVVAELARAFEQGDWTRAGAVFTDDVELKPPEGWPEAGPFFGRDAAVREFRRIQEIWQTNRVGVEIVAEQGDRLVARIEWSVEGATSGLPTEMTVFAAIRLEGRRIASYVSFWDRSEALAAAGLPAEG
jgi:ketosteroid isomerase-like protein